MQANEVQQHSGTPKLPNSKMSFEMRFGITETEKTRETIAHFFRSHFLGGGERKEEWRKGEKRKRKRKKVFFEVWALQTEAGSARLQLGAAHLPERNVLDCIH